MAAAAYFASVEAFEHELSGKAPVEDLGAVLHFDSADLDSNRAGQISPKQRTRLWHRDELQMAGAGVSMVGGIAFNVALLTGAMTVHGKGAGIGVSLMLIGGIFGWTSWLLWLDLAAGNVASVEGDLTTTTTSTRSGMSYFFVIAGKRFGVPREAFAEVREGSRRVYYLRHSGALLSIEPSA